MRLATYRLATPVGTVQRLGLLTADHLVLDLNLAYRTTIAERMEPSRATAVADAVLPADLLLLLANGALGTDAVATAADSFAGAPAGTASPDGAVLVHALADLTLLSPLPVPASLRDCSAYELHMANATQGNVPKRWYDFPTYYKGNRHAVVGTGAAIPLPPGCQKLDYELEYAVVIGRSGQDLNEGNVLDHVAGYLVFNDISARDVQFREMSVGLGPAKSKDADGTNVLGPFLVTPDEWNPHDAHRMTARVNGELWSDGLTSSIYHPVERILAHISRGERLQVGDVIGTGTVGGGCGLELGRYPQAGDTVELDIEGLGVLRNVWAAGPHPE